MLLVCVGGALVGCGTDVPATADTDDEVGSSSSGDDDMNATAPEQPGGGDEPAPADDSSSSSGDEPAGCGNGIIEGEEECDGDEFGDRTCGEYGASGGSLACSDDCRIELCECDWSEGDEPASCLPIPVCGNGVLESGESCDGGDFPSWEDTEGCEAVVGKDAWGDLNCTATCEIDTSECHYCGDGEFDPDNEECDGDMEVACADIVEGPWSGVATCTDWCEFDTSACEPLCGNGILDDGEACDGDVFGEGSCTDFGAVGGELECTASCTLSPASCDFCGNGVLDAGEACDGDVVPGMCGEFVPFSSGSPTCTDSCTYDLSVCPSEGGALLITEVMAVALPDPLFPPGEWVELHNPSDNPASLDGCALMGSAAFENSPLPAGVIVPPHAYFTLGSGSVEDLGFTPDAVLSKASAFQNAGDVIRLECSGFLIDEVEYSDDEPWPVYGEGQAIALSADGFDILQNDDGASWCSSTTPYAPGYQGTPGAPNDC